jgi:hypothetical protein
MVIMAALGLVGIVVLAAEPALAQPVNVFRNCPAGSVCAGGGQNDLLAFISRVISALLILVGAISVIAIIVGGLKYITANGDASAITQAKNTLIYAVVGLIVSLASYAIVGFVVGSF